MIVSHPNPNIFGCLWTEDFFNGRNVVIAIRVIFGDIPAPQGRGFTPDSGKTPRRTRISLDTSCGKPVTRQTLAIDAMRHGLPAA